MITAAPAEHAHERQQPRRAGRTRAAAAPRGSAVPHCHELVLDLAAGRARRRSGAGCTALIRCAAGESDWASVSPVADRAHQLALELAAASGAARSPPPARPAAAPPATSDEQPHARQRLARRRRGCRRPFTSPGTWSTTRPRRSMKNVSGRPVSPYFGDGHVRGCRARRVVDPVLAHELARVAGRSRSRRRRAPPAACASASRRPRASGASCLHG